MDALFEPPPYVPESSALANEDTLVENLDSRLRFDAQRL
jgi:hypothetical protein